MIEKANKDSNENSRQLYNVNVKNNLRPCEILLPPVCTDLEGIGVKVQCKITFSFQLPIQQACALTVTQIHV